MLLKELRKQTNCTIQQAKSLLETSNNDLEKAIELFHEQNIKHICQKTQCDEALARKFYKDKQGHLARTIATIENIMSEHNHRQRIFTMRTEKWRRNEMGYLIWGEKQSFDNYIVGENYNFIPIADFDLLLPAFEQVFPIYNHWYEQSQQHFSTHSFNTFDQEQIQIILSSLENIELLNPNEIQFRAEVMQWLSELRTENKLVIIEGIQ